MYVKETEGRYTTRVIKNYDFFKIKQSDFLDYFDFLINKVKVSQIHKNHLKKIIFNFFFLILVIFMNLRFFDFIDLLIF